MTPLDTTPGAAARRHLARYNAVLDAELTPGLGTGSRPQVIKPVTLRAVLLLLLRHEHTPMSLLGLARMGQMCPSLTYTGVRWLRSAGLIEVVRRCGNRGTVYAVRTDRLVPVLEAVA